MDHFNAYRQKRTLRQLFSGLVFFFILFVGWYIPFLGYFIPLCMLLGIGLGVSRGRKWCDWYCPRGSFYDTYASRISPQRKIPAVVRNLYFRIGIIALLLGIMTYNLVVRWPHAAAIGRFFVIMVGATTVLGVTLALVFHQRTWCLFCPIGTIIKTAGRGRNTLEIDSGLCVECKLCAKVCPVQIRPYAFKAEGKRTVADADCLRCGMCVAVCPKHALQFRKA